MSVKMNKEQLYDMTRGAIILGSGVVGTLIYMLLGMV